MISNPLATATLIFGSLILASLNVQAEVLQNERERERQAMGVVHQECYQARQTELSTLQPADKQKRIQCYLRASRLMGEYIEKWITGKTTVSYVNALYQECFYHEFAESNWEAIHCYGRCLDHPQVTHPDARWKNQPLEPQATDRFVAVRSRVNLQPQSFGANEPTSGVEISHSKGITPEVLALEAHQSHSPLSDSEAIEVAMRVAMVDEDERALSIGSVLLQQAGLSYHPVARSGMVVFGVGASPQVVGKFADGLVIAHKNLTDRYFETASKSPLLYVYANLDPNLDKGEDFGRKLSKALHFRGKNGIEGYYQPLDHSIVLRRGLRPPSAESEPARIQFYMGTPYHELGHALMHVEFPEAPRWLDEGIAALYEAMDLFRGPLDNYRIYFLQAALEEGKFPPLRALLDPSETAWRGPQQLLLAATARYFCFYLYEKEPDGTLLKNVYKNLRDVHASSESAFDVLKNETRLDMGALETEFRKFVASRKTDGVDKIWGSLRSDFEHIIREFVRPNWQ